MGSYVRILDDSNRLVVRHQIPPGTRFIDRWLIPLRHWWQLPAWVRLLPLLVLTPIPVLGLFVVQAWGRLVMTVGHSLWLPTQSSTWGLLLLGAIAGLVVFCGLILAPGSILKVISSGAVRRRMDAEARAQGVCIACSYHFGQLPPTTTTDGGSWVICPECAAAWDPERVNRQSSPPAPTAGYRTLFALGLKSPYFRQLVAGEKSKIALPLVSLFILLATLRAHAYILLRPDLVEWVMKYRSDTYWTGLFLPTLVPVAYLIVGSFLSGQAEIARLIPPVQSTTKLAVTPRPT